MAATFRRPLASRALPVQYPPLDNSKPTKIIPIHLHSTTAKRARSPDHRDNQAIVTAKRTRCTTIIPQEDRFEKEKRKTERDAIKEEFRAKYTKAFPSWTIYFDTNDEEKANLVGRVLQLNGVS